MPTRPRQHLDPDHCPANQGGRSPAGEERQRVTGRIVKPQKLKERSEEGQTAGGSDGCRAIAAKRRAGGNLAANCKNVGQCLVEIAHPLPQLCNTKHIRSQSKCKGGGITARRMRWPRERQPQRVASQPWRGSA